MTTEVTVVWDDGATLHERTTTELAEIVGLAAALDGRDRTLVTVFRGEAHAAVGGSSPAGLVVYVTFDQQAFHQLAAGQPAGAPNVTVRAGSQASEYPAHVVVDLVAAEAALAEFVGSGALSGDQRWEPTPSVGGG